MTDVVHAEELLPIEHDRDGGKFSAASTCPACGETAVHQLRTVNPKPPILVDSDTYEFRTFSGTIVHREELNYYDRWDERGFSVVRVCQHCTWEWGQR